jgi:hypothetical protein
MKKVVEGHNNLVRVIDRTEEMLAQVDNKPKVVVT